MSQDSTYEWILIIFVGLFVGILATNLSNLINKVIPYSVLLLVIGLILGGVDVLLTNKLKLVEAITTIDPHLFLQIFLPNLIFYSVFCTNYHTISRVFWQAFILAFFGLTLNSFLTALFFRYILPYKWEWEISLLFGAIISATDPVAVVTLLREIKASENLATLIEAESLFNDASAIVIFTLLIEIIDDVDKKNPTLYYVRTTLMLLMAPLFGIIVGLLVFGWIKLNYGDEIIETSITFVSCNLAYYFAEKINSSGILTTVFMGLVLVRFKAHISPKSLKNLTHFWELLEYIGKTLIFLMSGIIVSIKIFSTQNIRWSDFGFLICIYFWINITRALTLFVFYPLLRITGPDYTFKTQVVLWYGSLRGAIGLALALIAEQSTNIEESIREKIAFHVCGLVMMTLLINGTTVKYILQFLKIKGALYQSNFLIQTSLLHLENSSKVLLSVLNQNDHFSGANWTKVKSNLPEYSKLLKTESYGIGTKIETRDANIRYRFVCSMKSFYWKQHKDGLISTHAYDILIDAAEVAIDKNNLDAQWESLREHFKFNIFYKGVMKMSPCVKFIGNYFLISKIYLTVQLTTGFIFACDRVGIVINSYPEWKLPEVKLIENELKQVEEKAKLEWCNIQSSYTELFEAIQTKNANAFVLYKDIKSINMMKKQGIIQPSECKEMTEKIRKMIHKLRIKGKITTESEREMAFRAIPFITYLSPEIAQRYFSKTIYKNYSETNYMFREGDQKNGFFYILSGKIESISKSKYSEKEFVTNFYSGSILNLWSIMTNNPSYSTCVCITAVSAIKIPSSVCVELMKNERCEETMWKCAAFMLVHMLFKERFDSDQISNFGKSILRASLRKFKEKSVSVTCVVILLKGTATSNSSPTQKYNAPAMINSKNDSSQDLTAISDSNVLIQFNDAIALFMDNKGEFVDNSIEGIVSSIVDEETIERQQSLGLIYIKGSAESNRTTLRDPEDLVSRTSLNDSF